MNSTGLHRQCRRQVSERRLRHLVGHRARRASTEYFNDNYKAFSGLDPGNPAADRSYDAGAIVGLAIAQAGKRGPGGDQGRDPQGASIPTARSIHAGKDEFAKALQLIKDGKPIKYEGVIGPVTFDEYGDITGPFRLWRIKDGEVTTVGEMTHRRRQRDQGEDRQLDASQSGVSPSRRRPRPKGGRLLSLGRVRMAKRPSVDCHAPERIELAPGLTSAASSPASGRSPTWRRDGRDARPRPRRRRAWRAYAEAGLRHLRHGRSLRQRRGHRRPLQRAWSPRGKVRVRGRAPALFTKWCPTPGADDAETVRAAVERALTRLQTRAHRPPAVPLVDVPASRLARRACASWRSCSDEGLIGHLGVTNFDTDHLRLLVRQGIPHRHQPGLLLAARPPRGGGDDARSASQHGVRLLAYGTLGRRPARARNGSASPSRRPATSPTGAR